MNISFFFKTSTPKQEMDAALKECNTVVLEDFGPLHVFDPSSPPDLLLIGRDTDNAAAIGLLTLHYTEASRAWELGTMSVKKSHRHGKVFVFFMQHVSGILASVMQGDNAADVWIVKRVAQTNTKHIDFLKRMGFEAPPHFLVGVLSNDGYIPFDPFDEVLMKRRISAQ